MFDTPKPIEPQEQPQQPAEANQPAAANAPRELGPRELGGREGPEPTRYGDWELRGRCIDF